MKPRVPAALALVVVAACGSGDDGAHGGHDGDGTGADRTIEIEMRDIAYSPDTVTVDAGETIRFVFTNNGELTHDAFIGDQAAQDDHEAELNSDGGEASEHDGHGPEDADAITVEPGGTGELTHTFTEDDELVIGCHEPGHYAAGMRVTIDVD